MLVTKAPTISPVFGVTFIAFIPDPPRFCVLNCFKAERLPYPFCDSTKSSISLASLAIISIPTIRSFSSFSFIPRTPPAFRPIGRTSDSLKRTDCPSAVVMTTSSLPVVGHTQPNTSPFSKVIAIKPLRRTFSNSSSFDFLTVPFRVAMNRYLYASSLFREIISVIFSSWEICRKLTMACPRAVREDSGIS